MGNGALVPCAASAAPSGAGTPRAPKETAAVAAGEAARTAATGLVRRLARGADVRSAGIEDKKNLRCKVAAFRRPPHPWKPARSYQRTTGAPRWPRLSIGSSRAGLPFLAPGPHYSVSR